MRIVLDQLLIKTSFYRDETGRLRHPRQSGKNITLAMAKERGWEIVVRKSKNRYLWLLPDSKKHKKKLIEMCKYNLKDQKFN